jgi:serine acetyltransferase
MMESHHVPRDGVAAFSMAAMVGAMAVATKDVRAYHVYVGIPAKSVRVKPNAPVDQGNLTAVKPR